MGQTPESQGKSGDSRTIEYSWQVTNYPRTWPRESLAAEIQRTLCLPRQVPRHGLHPSVEKAVFPHSPKAAEWASRDCVVLSGIGVPGRDGFLEGVTSDQLYLRPLQCVNELNQWLSALRKVSINNTGLLGSYHPGVFRGDKWSCCHQKDKTGGDGGSGPAVLHLFSAGSLVLELVAGDPGP